MGLHDTVIVNDIVLDESNCNLSCSYCLTGQSKYRSEHEEQLIFSTPRGASLSPNEPLGERMHDVLYRTRHLGIPAVKLSGGEVTRLPGWVDLVELASSLFETVILLTNASGIKREAIARLVELGNVSLQVSLDGTRYWPNSYRVSNEKAHQSLMKRIWSALESDLTVEVYLVLNDRSIDFVAQTLLDIRLRAKECTVMPFPLRGPDVDRFRPSEQQVNALEKVFADQEPGLLPPGPYLDSLLEVMRGKRTRSCHLPRVAITTFDDRQVTSCPNIWFDKQGNLDQPDVLKRLDESRFRRLLLAKRPRVSACWSCFTPWDPLSLFLNGQISMKDLECIPVFRGPEARRRLSRLSDAESIEGSLACAHSVS